MIDAIGGTRDRFFLGTMTVIVGTPRLNPPIDKAEERIVGNLLLERVQERLNATYPGVFILELVSTQSGCVKVKFRVFAKRAALVGGILAAFGQYSAIRQSAIDAVEDVNKFVSLASDWVDRATGTHAPVCVSVHSALVTEAVYEVKPGDNLSTILTKHWKVPPAMLGQVARWVVDSHPNAFVGGDANRLNVGAILCKPTAEMLRHTPSA